MLNLKRLSLFFNAFDLLDDSWQPLLAADLECTLPFQNTLQVVTDKLLSPPGQ